MTKKKHDPEVTRRRWLKSRYGLTPDEWDRLLAEQNSMCAICGAEILPIGTGDQRPGRKAAVTDHCHESGKVRGLLCANCNMGIGNLQDNPAIVFSAFAYLQHHHEVLP